MVLGPFAILDLLLFSSLFAYIPFVCLFACNYKVQPIVARNPFFIIALDIALYIVAISELWVANSPATMNCVIKDLLCFGYLAGFSIYMVRLVQLLFAYQINANLLEHKRAKGITEWKQNWYSRNRWIIRPSTIQHFFTLQNIIYAAVCCICLFVDPGNIIPGGCRIHKPQYFWLNFVLANEGLILGICLFLGWKLRHCEGDAWSLKKEVTINSYVCLVCFIIYAALEYRVPYSITSLATYIILHSVFLTSTVYPYYLSEMEKRSFPEQERLVEKQGSVELRDLLLTQEGFENFLNYLKTEFSSENLLFWQQVEQVKKRDPGDPAVKELILGIYHQFCQENASYQLNLPYDIAENIRDNISKLLDGSASQSDTMSVFDEAQDNIYNLMKADSYQRYQIKGLGDQSKKESKSSWRSRSSLRRNESSSPRNSQSPRDVIEIDSVLPNEPTQSPSSESKFSFLGVNS